MITVSIDGRITKDATMRQAGSTPVCSFSVASNKKVKGEDQATFIDVSIFGKRGETLCEHLKKGKYVIVAGELSTRVHNDKTYLQCEASGISFAPSKRSEGGASGSGSSESKPAGGGGYDDADYGGGGGDDDIPFLTCSFSASEPWWRF